MATKKPRKSEDPADIAIRLIDTENQLRAIEESKAPLLLRKAELREQMLISLKEHHLASLETVQGVTFSRAFRASLLIANPLAALDWAIAHDCAVVDKVLANKLLKGAGALPEGFEHKETEYLSTTGLKDL